MKVCSKTVYKTMGYSPNRMYAFFLLFFVFSLSFMSTISLSPHSAYACCVACAESDCENATDFIEEAHEDIRERVKTEFDDDLTEFHQWLIYMLETQFGPGTGAMLNQLAAAALYYTQMVGSFMDAQFQMDTQRVMRKMQFDAHKAYHPSESMCVFGSNVRSLASSDTIARFNSLALGEMGLARQTGYYGVAGAYDQGEDYRARWNQFVDTYCDVGDNNRISSTTGLELACDRDGPGGATDAGAEDWNRFNRDIDYTRLIEEPRTITLDMRDNTLDDVAEPFASLTGVGPVYEPGEEEDVIAMSKNLYGHKVPSRDLAQIKLTGDAALTLFLSLRSVAAKRSVAQASFNAIVGIKSSGSSHEKELDPFTHPGGLFGVPLLISNGLLAQKQSRRFMAAIMDQLLPASVLTGANIFDLIGYSPSYYSQLEVLSKRIYQNPDFYAGLYDSPANVERKKVAMKAIELMLDRAIYESQLRREMVVSVLLSSKLRASHRNANDAISTAVSR